MPMWYITHDSENYAVEYALPGTAFHSIHTASTRVY
jgi:hypothetical protein